MTEDRREAPRVPVEKDVDASVSGVRVRLLELSVTGARIEHAERFPLKGAQLTMTWNLRTIVLQIRVARSEIAGRSEAGLLYQSGVYFVRTDYASDSFVASIIGDEAVLASGPPPPAQPLSLQSEEASQTESLPQPAADVVHGRKLQPEAVTVRKIDRHHDPVATPAAVLDVPRPPEPARMQPPQPAPAPRVQERPGVVEAPEPAQEAPPSLYDDSWVREVNFLRDDPEDQLPYAQYRLTPGGWEKTYVATPDQPEDGFTIERGQKDFIELQRTFEWADEDTRRMLRAGLKARMGQV